MQVLLVFAALVAPSLARLPYIVNGKDAEPGQFPWQASLQMYGYYHICGASVVSDTWLVTASHCVGSSPSSYSIVLGAHDKDSYQQGSPQRYQIAEIIMHPDYRSGGSASQAGDIALIRLASPADLSNKYISTIALADEDEDFADMDCHISGWGSLYGIGSQSPNILQELDVTVFSTSQCSRYTSSAGKYHLCVFKQGSSACSGDSGGPLACEKDGQFKLVGAASFVWGSCSTYYPTVYTSVPYYREWIRQHSGL